ncbi:MAG: response regulator, partial [Candidatus Eisenbacteria bacterium]
QKRLELVCRVEPDVPDGLVGDPTRVQQVLINLVGNALKFTHQGEVELHVSCDRTPGGPVQLRFAVRDTGIGIPHDQQRTVFEAFRQADGSTTRRYGGTGLGLSISVQLAELMGGRLTLDSTLGKGSTFTLHAPFALDPASLAPAPLRSLSGRSILVAEDHAATRASLVADLEAAGAHTLVVESRSELLSALSHAADHGQQVDALLVDSSMLSAPDGEPVSTARRWLGDGLPVLIMQPSHLSQEHARRCAGRPGAVLAKPVFGHDLEGTLQWLFAETLGESAEPRDAAPAATGVRRALRVLLAEDNDVNRLMIRRTLEKFGHTVTEAADGVEAVLATREHPFDVVLMDAQMPELNGFEATQRIRADEVSTGRRLPIVALTAHAMQGDRERCLAAGMDDYLTKPIETERLLATLERVAATEPTAAAPSPPESSPLGSDAYDEAQALRFMGGDRELLTEAIDLHLSTAAAWLERMRRALDEHDLPELGRQAHRAKSELALVGGTRASDAAQQLNRVALAGTAASAAAALSQLETAVAELHEALHGRRRAA